MPAAYYVATYDVTSEFWFRNSLSAGMRNANISYTLPTPISSRLGIASVRLFFTATNVFNFFNPIQLQELFRSLRLLPHAPYAVFWLELRLVIFFALALLRFATLRCCST